MVKQEDGGSEAKGPTRRDSEGGAVGARPSASAGAGLPRGNTPGDQPRVPAERVHAVIVTHREVLEALSDDSS